MWGEIKHFLAYKKKYPPPPPNFVFFSEPLSKMPFGISERKKK